MPSDQWIAVDEYLSQTLLGPDAALDAALADSAAAGLPAIAVSPLQGKLLHLLAQTAGARRILEIGTLGGYSTIWLARALPPDGRLITIECEPRHAAVAEVNLRRAGVQSKVDLRVGKASDVLATLESERAGPFDFVFIDADKQSTPEYVRRTLSLSRPGSIIVVDNVIRGGKVADAGCADAGVIGIREFNALLATEKRVSATAIQTVGSKGYDGFALVRVLS